MKQYRFDQKTNQTIVDGILQGYKNYLEERKEKQESMKISSGYAWVRGNHIDDQTATSCEGMGIEYHHAKAGASWGYLQFFNEDERKMFIIKNGRYLNKDNVSSRGDIHNQSKVNEDHYLYKLAQINKKVEFTRLQQMKLPLENETVTFDDQMAMNFPSDEMERLQNDFDYFYIISYEIDHYGMISRIQLFLPSFIDGKAHEVEDLTGYIETSDVDFSDVDISIGEEDQQTVDTEYPDAAWFDIITDDKSSKKSQ